MYLDVGNSQKIFCMGKKKGFGKNKVTMLTNRKDRVKEER